MRNFILKQTLIVAAIPVVVLPWAADADEIKPMLDQSREERVAGATELSLCQPDASRIVDVPRALPSTEEQALLEIQEEGRRCVRDITRLMLGMADGPERRNLELQALRIKRQYRILFLQTKASFARGRGDLAAARAIEERIERILHPKPHPIAPAHQPVKKARDKALPLERGGQP